MNLGDVTVPEGSDGQCNEVRADSLNPADDVPCNAIARHAARVESYARRAIAWRANYPQFFIHSSGSRRSGFLVL